MVGCINAIQGSQGGSQADERGVAGLAKGVAKKNLPAPASFWLPPIMKPAAAPAIHLRVLFVTSSFLLGITIRDCFYGVCLLIEDSLTLRYSN
jgi:hypothetical protein